MKEDSKANAVSFLIWGLVLLGGGAFLFGMSTGLTANEGGNILLLGAFFAGVIAVYCLTVSAVAMGIRVAPKP